jgi:hypothetical protein
MTCRTVAATAEWALHGKRPNDRDGYRVLGCSDGGISRRNFEEVLDRFSLGTPDSNRLPQVSVSYLEQAVQADGGYIALAIHKFADGGQHDADGRPIELTRYFCVPYKEMADDAITYHAMYEAFRAIDLPMGTGSPVPVTLTAAPPLVPGIGDLALQVASLLLTGRKVCVLGAQRTSMAERLQFIDRVMSLLPYGMRGRMSASTWTRSTFKGHRFRLFFSDTPRAIEEPDHLVVWGRPDQTDIPAGDAYAWSYLDWLQDRVSQPVAKLSRITDVSGFSRKHALEVLETIGITGLEPEPDDPADRQDSLHSERMPARGSKAFAEKILLDCVRLIAEQNLHGLRADVTALRNYADSTTPTREDRKRYQEIVWRSGLLSPGLRIGRLHGRFYDALLRLVFGTPLSYTGYCELEDCLGAGNPPAQPPHRALLEAIDHGQLADLRATAIVKRNLGEAALGNWFRSGQVNAAQLIAMIADEWDRPHHARIICEVALRYLDAMQGKYSPRYLRSRLRAHGYLARALEQHQAGDPQYQADVIRGLLLAAFGPDGLDGNAITDIMTGTSRPPTPALLAAVLLLLTDPADGTLAMLAEKGFVAGLLLFTDFSPGTRQRLSLYCPAGGRDAPGSWP